MRWLALCLLLFATRAHAQAEEPGPALDDAYRDCQGCEGWTDPYAYELAQLHARRPSYFWPHALILAGAGAMASGVLMADAAHPEVLIAPVVAGAVALTFGLVWRAQRSRERESYDRRIAELEAARAKLPRVYAAVPPVIIDNEEMRALRRARPSIGLPIALTSLGLAAVGVGSFALFIGYALHEPSAIAPGAAIILGGAAVVAGGAFWWYRTRSRQRPYNERIRALKQLSFEPFIVRW